MPPARTRPPPTALPGPLALLVEQLWQPAVTAGRARVVLDPDRGTAWRTVERYRVLPGPARARLLLPAGSRALAVRALTNYRGLRPARVNVGRALTGVALAAGVPLARHTLAVQRRVDVGAPLPLELLATRLGLPVVHASLGVRTGANRKATLQLLDDVGTPVGYAKFGWSPASSALVRTETAALRELHPGTAARAPAVLAEGTWEQLPYLVTAPLPVDSRRIAPGDPPPSPQEVAALSPVVRRARPSESGQLAGLRVRLSVTGDAAAGVQRRAAALVHRIARTPEVLPVAARWHGDLTPWNTARDADGTLWVWDWENAEPDAVAGLDSLHWALSDRRERGERVAGATLRAALDDAHLHLAAVGLSPTGRALVAALYAAVVTERACALARDDGWGRLWISREQLEDLLRAAEALLDGAPAERAGRWRG